MKPNPLKFNRPIEKLLALYRYELERWSGPEMLAELIEEVEHVVLKNEDLGRLEPGDCTADNEVLMRLDRECAALIEALVSVMVKLGHADAMHRFVESQARDRAECEERSTARAAGAA